MRTFLERISSRKFLMALAIQIAAVVALFFPGREEAAHNIAVQIAALATLLLAGLGYGKIESSLDADQSVASKEKEQEVQ